MSTLVADELITELVQPIEFNQRMIVESIKLHLHVQNVPAGTFTFKVFKGLTEYASFNFTSTSLRTAFGGIEDNFHIYMPFVFTNGYPFERGSYTFKIEQSGYTYSASSFLAWCKDYGGIFGSIDDPNAEFTDYPYSFRIIERRRREL